jgi:peptidoglycan/LPS O-acetylase OafA/YrhL
MINIAHHFYLINLLDSRMKFRFPNLDSIRTLAFLSVFAAHSFSTENTVILRNDFYLVALSLRKLFAFGVPIFFVLSGFLISYLMLNEQDRKNDFSIKNFYIRRVLRI